jgi:hypothetical protein
LGGIKLFESAQADIKENVLETGENEDPLEEPKMYLNIVHNDTVLTPLNKKRELADKKNDKDWMIIPIAFDGPKKTQKL